MKFSIKKQGFLYTSKSVFLKKGFTIREILIVIVILSVGLLSVVVVLTDGMGYVQKTRQKIIALNLARE
jgi:prepilin-type N-terminal cleavage/methylation domain-containing protein